MAKASNLEGNFHELCKSGPRASVYRSPSLDARLRCRFHHRGDPYLRLAPFKMEERSEQPLVVAFHDFMSDSEVEHYKAEAVKNMIRSVTGQGAKSASSLTRTSKQAWLADRYYAFDVTLPDGNATKDVVYMSSSMRRIFPLPENHIDYRVVYDPIAYRVSLRIQNATELIVNDPFSSEAYQIANYGMGGQYNTHLDPHGYYQNDSSIRPDANIPYFEVGGDRFATFMVYLSDVAYGGDTVFPLAGLSASPERGTGIFWLNLHPAGYQDRWTSHGGCPVLVGSKWITNKWVHYHDQFRRFPCSLSHRDIFSTLQQWRDAESLKSAKSQLLCDTVKE